MGSLGDPAEVLLYDVTAENTLINAPLLVLQMGAFLMNKQLLQIAKVLNVS